MPRYVIANARVSWHQRRAGHGFSSVLILDMTEEEAKKRVLRDGDILYTEDYWNEQQARCERLHGPRNSSGGFRTCEIHAR